MPSTKVELCICMKQKKLQLKTQFSEIIQFILMKNNTEIPKMNIIISPRAAQSTTNPLKKPPFSYYKIQKLLNQKLQVEVLF